MKIIPRHLVFLAGARDTGELVTLINAYRKAPASCEGRRSAMLAPLARNPVLARVRIVAGTFLEPALERAGFPVEHAVAGQPRPLRQHHGSRLCGPGRRLRRQSRQPARQHLLDPGICQALNSRARSDSKPVSI